MRYRFASLILIALALALVAGASGCAGTDPANELTLAPESALPDFLESQPAEVKIAYRFAIANPDVLHQYPCYCGCGNMGHKDNLGCYIKEFRPDGSIEFDSHAFG